MRPQAKKILTTALLLVISISAILFIGKKDTSSLSGKSILRTSSEAENISSGTSKPVDEVILFTAIEKEGFIGYSRENPVDNPEDNTFHINIKEELIGNETAWLEYELNGIVDYTSVSHSINDRLSTGGYLVRKSSGWHKQKERVTASVIRKGDNIIRFTVPEDMDYGYRVRNISLHIEKNKDPDHRELIVNQPSTAYYYQKTGYLKGFVSGQGSKEAMVLVSGDKVRMSQGVFESIVEKPSGGGESWEATVEAIFPDGQKLMTMVQFNKPVEADYRNHFEKEIPFTEQQVSSEAPFTISLQGATLSGKKGSIEKSAMLSVIALRDIDIPLPDPGMINVTKGYKGFRFLPHGTKFNNEVSLQMAYDTTLIPDGYGEADIRTYYFSEETNHWVALPRDTVLYAQKMVVSRTDHFTDMINAIIKVPESPETQGYTPTSMKDVKAANPASGINLISPPSANQMGNANISYPLNIPGGRRGMQPGLAIQYNSGGGNGWLGLGWDLSILSISIDNRWGVPRYDGANESETYIMSGEMLSPVAHRGPWVARVAERQFFPRVEGSYSIIKRHGKTPKEYWWEVTDKNGVRYFYGGFPGTNMNSNATLCDTIGNISYWALTETRDLNGNFVRYHYKRVFDRGVVNGVVPGKQLYLEKITYTGFGDKEGRYSVEFTRDRQLGEERRPDVTINARNGFKEVTADLLRKIVVKYDDNNTAEVIRSYELKYRQGAFFKTLLDSIVESDAKGKRFTAHGFDYYDDVRVKGIYTPFKDEQEIEAPPENVKGEGKLSWASANAVGGSRTRSSGVGTYVGFGPGTNIFTKARTAGFDYDHDNSETYGLLALVDIDGDGLSDRVYQSGSGLKYRRRLPDNPTMFADGLPINGEVNVFEYTKSKSNRFGLGVYPSGKSYVGGSKNFTTTETSAYFTDANGDGLIDIVSGGRVYFNRIVDGRPFFSSNPAGTPAPVHGEAKVSSDLDFSTLNGDEVNELKEKNPLQDAVKMWIAPFDGVIKIHAPLHLTPKQKSESKFLDGVQVSIQKNSEVLWSKSVNKDNFNNVIPAGVDSIKVSKNDCLFFRVHSVDNGFDDAVLWNPTVNYLGRDTTLTDPDNKPFYRYNAGKDFLLSGNYYFSPMFDGVINIESTLKKPKLSDDVDVLVIRIRENTEADTLLYSSLSWQTDTIQQINLTGLEVLKTDLLFFRVYSASNVNWSAIEWKPYLYYTESKDEEVTEVTGEGGQHYYSAFPVVHYSIYPVFSDMGDIYTVPEFTDELEAAAELKSSAAGKTGSFELIAQKVNGSILGSTTINIEKGRFVTDSILKFSCQSGTRVNFILKNFSGITTDNVSDSVQISSGNSLFRDLKHPVAKVFEYDPQTTISISGNMINPPVIPPDIDPREIMWVTVKTYDTLLVKSRVSYFSGIPVVKCNVFAGQKLFISYFTKSTFWLPYLNKEVKITINKDETKAKVFIYSALPDKSNQFGNLYRGWGQFGYNGNDGFLPIDPGKLTIDKDVEKGDEDFDENNLTGSKDMDELEGNFNDGGGYDASSADFIVMRPDIAAGKWVGYDDLVFISADTISSSRMGEKEITSGSYLPDPGETFFAPVKKNKSNTIAASGNVFGFGASGSITESRMLSDYSDMNGDRYPDIITNGVIQYTTQRGGLSAQTLNVGDVNNSTATTQGLTAGGSIMQLSMPRVSKKPDLNLKGNMKKASIIGSASISKSTSDDLFNYMDMNGDGLPDKIFYNGTVSLNLGYSFAEPEKWGYKDGIQKIEVMSAQGGLGLGGGSLNIDLKTGKITGGSFQVSIKGESFMAGVGLYSSNSNPGLVFMDVNSDGLADQVRYDEGTNEIMVYLNKGSRLDSIPIKWTSLGKLNETVSLNGSYNIAGTFGIPFAVCRLVFNPRVNNALSVSRSERQLMDFDGDGNLDYVTSHDVTQIKVSSSTIGRTNLLKSVKRPMGSGFDLEYAQVGNTYDMPQSQWVLSSVAVNDGHKGDGADRMLTTFEYENGYQDRYERSFYGFGKVITNQHDTQNADSVYRSTTQVFANSNYFNKGLQLSETMQDSKGRKYVETVNSYSLKNPGTMADLDIDFNATDLVIAQKGFFTAFPALKETKKYFYEGRNEPVKSSGTAFVYGPYGNVTGYTDSGDLSDNTDDIAATIGYHELKSLNIVSEPSSITVTGGGKTFRKRETSIDSKTGDITEIRQFVSDGASASYNMYYDVYGNLDSVIRPRNYNGQRMYFGYTYDPQVHTFVTGVRDAHGLSSSSEYDYRFGAVVKTKDINGQLTKYTIDDLGRIKTITGPYELAAGKAFTIEFEYHQGDSIPWALTRHYDPANPANYIETALFIDGLGRVLQTKKDGALFTGKKNDDTEVMIVLGQVYYDAFGRAIKSLYPVTESKGHTGLLNRTADNIAPTRVTYDVMDRNLTTTLPDGSVTKTSYGFDKDRAGKLQFLTTVTDANGKVSETFTDVRGRQTAVKAPGDTWTSFVYDPIGQLVAATDPENNTTTSAYDMLGRRLSRKHPDAGMTEYTYDLAGNMTRQVTANLKAAGKEVKYEYDFNRLTAIKYPLNTFNDVRFVYGKAGDKYNRAGRISVQEDATGAQEFFYGPLGEITKNIRTIVVPGDEVYTFTTQWEYDTWNRLTGMTYPDGEKLQYAYNTGGQLKSMKGEKTGQPYNYLTRMGYDKFENRVYLSYGNGTETSYSYEPDRRRLEHITATTSKGRKMMENTYTYDKVDNIMGIINEAPIPSINRHGGPSSYSYQYDDLYRLTYAGGKWEGSTSSSRFTMKMAYSPTGRILEKKQTHDRMSYEEPGVWIPQHKTTYDLDYRYESSQPHAATHIGENTYTYDANGNQTGWTNDNNGTRRGILWDEENRIRAIADNGVTHHYIYDASGERVIKSNGDGQAIYVNGFPMGGSGTVGNYTMYVNPFLVVQNSKYTKHFYIEGQRIVSKLGAQSEAQFVKSAHAGDSIATPVQWDKKKERSKDIIIANFEALGLDGAVFTAGKSGKMPYGQIKKYLNSGGSVVNPGGGSRPSRYVDENLQFYYHPDHLGSSNYITNASGEVYQHEEYFPFGETFVEERNSAEYTTYLFNGKELDEETGLYFYGARYYDPRVSTWYGVDPLAEKYPGLSPFAYTANNPIIFIDPNGLVVDDYYSSTNGKYLGSDGAVTNNLRLIDEKKFNEIKAANCENTKSVQATGELQQESKVIEIDEGKIQNDLQTIRDNSKNSSIEHQLYLYLDRDNAIISSIIGTPGTNSESILSSFPAPSQGLNFIDNNDSPRNKILIGQAHGHPDSKIPGSITLRTMSLDKDLPRAIENQIPIYGIDAMKGSGAICKPADIHRANPDGSISNKVGKTAGAGPGSFNIGRDAIQIWGRSGKPKF